MNEEPESSWTAPFGDWRLRLAWFALVAVLAGVVASDLAEEPGRMVLFAILIASAVLFLAAFVRWLCCWRNVRKVLLVAFIASGMQLLAAFARWCCRWRNARRVLLAVASLVTLLALIRTEEDWRGKRAWVKFKREQEALGLRFDVASVAPPPVPDEQNFAMSPIVSTCYGTILDREGAVKGMEAPPKDEVNRMNMPVDDGNGPKRAIGRWENAETSDLGILQRYYRELAAKTNLFPVPPQPRSPAKDVLLALSKYDASIEELRRASTLPCSRFPVEYGAANPANLKLPHLICCKRTVQLLRLRAVAELQNGQTDKALAEVLLALRMGESIRSEPLLISHLVRIAMFNLTLQPIYEGLAQHRWSGAELESLSTQLARLDFLADFQLAMRGEVVFATGTLEYLRQHREIDFAGDHFTDVSAPRRILSRVLKPDGFFYQNELAIARLHLRWSFPIVDAQRRLVVPALASEKELARGMGRSSPYNKYARMFLPFFRKTAGRFALGESNANLARVAVALERYRLAHGEYPETLAPLAPQFIAAIPHDIINGQPLHYSREGDGHFTLYSVGWNQTDEGGTVVLDKAGESVNVEEGDWVWRYDDVR
jgi:hypothetical protein